MNRRALPAIVASALAIPLAALAAGDAPLVATGKLVSVEYTLSDADGKQIESNKGDQPLVYEHGQNKIIPGLEKAMTGMKIGQEKDVTVPPAEGYGEVDKNAFQEVPKDKFPAEALKAGTLLRATSPEGVEMPVRVSEVREKTVLVDFNHPMAGKTLKFHVKVLDVKDAKSVDAPKASGPAKSDSKTE